MHKLYEYLTELPDDARYAILIGIIILGAFIVMKFLRWMIHGAFRDDDEISPADATRLTFLKNAVSLVVWLIAIGSVIYTIPKLRSIAVTLFAGAGILLAILGLAAQEAFSNIIGGIFIVIFKPFRVGDFIKVGDLDYGWVEDITLRHTTIKSYQNKRIIIPNSKISSENITNDTIIDTKVCRWVEVGISYDSNIDTAMDIMRDEALNHPLSIDNRSEDELEAEGPIVDVRVVSLGEYSVNLRAFVWAENTPNAITMHHNLNKSIKERFDREDVEIPFPYRTVVYKTDIPRQSN